MEVEEYTYLKYYEMLRIVEEKDVLSLQGKPLVIVYSGQFTEDFLGDFFELTFSVLSKIVLQKGDIFYLLCNKYERECIEPFSQIIDQTKEIANKPLSIVSYIMK
jgi:hypothetical protein